jgi:peptidoglycan/xylan/chitin deacetylase (PgdA/CDA1 family)
MISQIGACTGCAKISVLRPQTRERHHAGTVSSDLSFRRRPTRRTLLRRWAVLLSVVALAVALVAVLAGSAGGPGRDSRAAMRRQQMSARPARPHRISRETTQSRLQSRAVERVRRRMPFIVAGGGSVREIALTFDDGPGPYSPRLIATLRRLHVPATFFAVGQAMRYFHGATSAELRDRYVVGDHTQGHPFMARLAPAAQRDQIVTGAQSLHLYGVPWPQLYRPPYRSFNNVTIQILRQLKMLMVLWTVDSQDYRRPGVAAIVQQVLAGAKPGAIVLMHDGGGIRTQTIDAIPFIVRQLRRRHYRLVTVPRMMLDDPPRHRQQLPKVGD